MADNTNQGGASSNEKSYKCPKCGMDMEKGIMKGGGGSYCNTEQWGTKVSRLFRNIENAKNIIVYRCKNCGYLENYAP